MLPVLDPVRGCPEALRSACVLQGPPGPAVCVFWLLPPDTGRAPLLSPHSADWGLSPLHPGAHVLPLVLGMPALSASCRKPCICMPCSTCLPRLPGAFLPSLSTQLKSPPHGAAEDRWASCSTEGRQGHLSGSLRERGPETRKRLWEACAR